MKFHTLRLSPANQAQRERAQTTRLRGIDLSVVGGGESLYKGHFVKSGQVFYRTFYA